ncbi:hypothetical protein CsSME_00021747 [Camellia sinensis var. sinensis]
MARILNALIGGSGNSGGGVIPVSGGLFLLCAVVVSLSIISMILFACLDDPVNSGRNQQNHHAHAHHSHMAHAAHANHMHMAHAAHAHHTHMAHAAHASHMHMHMHMHTGH